MKNTISDNKEFLLIFSIFGLLMLLFGAFLKITHYSFAFFTGNLLLSIGIIILLPVWILVFIDIFRTKPKNGLLWILGMIIFINITPLIYIITRKK